MIVGLLPSLRSGLGDLERTGQRSRLVDGYLKPYAQVFDEVWYFSYLRESLDEPELAGRVHHVPGPVDLASRASLRPVRYAFLMPMLHRAAFRRCDVLRVFQVTGVIPALIARRLHGTPFVTTYGFSYEKLSGSETRRRLRRMQADIGLSAAAAVIVTTEQLRAEVRARGVPSQRIFLIPNGVDTSAFRPLDCPQRQPREVLYVGRLSAEKNLKTLIEALAKLAGRHAVRLTFVGDGPERPALESAAQGLGVSLRITGFVDHRELPLRFADADAFVLPSLTEGHPKVLLEAMSCGLPCVASHVDGNRAIVEPGKTGLVFDPRDASGLADALDRIFTDADLARRLGANARRRIVESYDLGRLVAREIELLREIVARHRGGR